MLSTSVQNVESRLQESRSATTQNQRQSTDRNFQTAQSEYGVSHLNILSKTKSINQQRRANDHKTESYIDLFNTKTSKPNQGAVLKSSAERHSSANDSDKYVDDDFLKQNQSSLDDIKGKQKVLKILEDFYLSSQSKYNSYVRYQLKMKIIPVIEQTMKEISSLRAPYRHHNNIVKGFDK